eukprot:767410-Hanusia_phi.AAC.4
MQYGVTQPAAVPADQPPVKFPRAPLAGRNGCPGGHCARPGRAPGSQAWRRGPGPPGGPARVPGSPRSDLP